uniref:Ionotropic glutamate receptor C-terminal domain-containing protein n=1 Tax=Musca domestica TaxID=7370 RepID=A0A1I8N3K3_MUSDO
MRQVRVVIFMEDSRREEELEVKEEVLKISGKYKMTNVLLSFEGATFYQLRPYPEYHWLERRFADNLPYFPQHWRNMSQKHILTYTDQTAPRTVITAVDTTMPQQGVPKMNGFVARLVLLFAELFNARLEMCCNFHWKNVTPYPVINQMVDREQLDIPMSLDPVLKGNYSYRSQVYDVGKAFLMVPCSEAFSLQEISKMLLKRNFFGYIFICGFLLTALHSLTDYLLDGQFDWRDLLINERILPGVLAQASVARKSPWLVIKITYVLLFLAGLNISAQFSARMNTLFTRPPHHRDIESLQDIEDSSMKILLESSEAKTIEKVLKPISKSLVLTNQTARYLQMRRDLNTSYGYAVNTAVWKMLRRKQNYFPHKVFCTSDKLTIFPFIHWTIRLQANSEYKEPLDYLILRVHELGLMKAWHGSTFVDMLRLKQITLANPNAKEEFFILREQDLMWIWVMEMVGLTAACAVFLLELMWPRVGDGRRLIGKCCKILLSKFCQVV